MITITIDNTNLENAAIIALADALRQIQSDTPETTSDNAPTDANPVKRRNRRTETPVPDNEPAPSEPNEQKVAESVNDQDASEQTDSEPSPDIPTVVDLRAKAQEKGTTKEAKKAIKELLNEFDSKSISDVPEDKRAEFLGRLEEL